MYFDVCLTIDKGWRRDFARGFGRSFRFLQVLVKSVEKASQIFFVPVDLINCIAVYLDWIFEPRSCRRKTH